MSATKETKDEKIDRVLGHTFNSFAIYQEEAQERYRKYDEECWAKQVEFEQERRLEDKEHEERMLRVMEQVFQRGSRYH